MFLGKRPEVEFLLGKSFRGQVAQALQTLPGEEGGPW